MNMSYKSKLESVSMLDLCLVRGGGHNLIATRNGLDDPTLTRVGIPIDAASRSYDYPKTDSANITA